MKTKALNRYEQFLVDIKAYPEIDPNKHQWGTRRIPTNDDWCGTNKDGTVEGSVNVLLSGELRICFWGNDDMGMELDLPLSVEAYYMWNNWLSNLTFISRKTLKELGFKYA